MIMQKYIMQNYIIHLNFATFPHSEAYYFNYFSLKIGPKYGQPDFFAKYF